MAQSVQYTRTELMGSGTVIPRFFIDSVQDEMASAAHGRPIFRDVERVEIILPGNPHLRPVHAVNDEHRMRWQREYEAFRNGVEISPEGTPLEDWPVLSRSQVLELKGLALRTVEDVARMTDTATQRIGTGGQLLRERAVAFLDDAASSAFTTKVSAENEQLITDNTYLKQQVETMKGQLDQLFAERQARLNAPDPLLTMIPGASDPVERAKMAAPQAEMAGSSFDALAPRRRGRPPKDRSEEAA